MRTSNLDSPGDRFLSLCMQYAIDEDWLTAADLNEEFSAEKLMGALEGSADLRAKLLVQAAGVHEKIAPKKSTNAAAEDLQLALDEELCTPETVLELMTIDEYVRHLDKGALWELLTRDEFWFQDGDRPQARMLQMITTGLDQDLVDLHRLIRAVTPEQLASDLPRDLLESALATAIHSGLDSNAFEPEAVVESLQLQAWVENISLDHLWDTAIKNEIAASANLTTATPVEARAAGEAKSKGKRRGKKKNQGKDKDDEAASPAPAAEAGSDAEQQARARAIENLRKLERLPNNVDSLASPVLLALDSMYEDLLETETDEERAEQIREAFPNPSMLEEALFAMAETLDPRLTKEALQERGADSNSIIQLILFEERRRAAQSGRPPTTTSSPPPSVKPASVPPPPPSAASTSGVPPLPPQARASTPPPPLPNQARKQVR